MRKLIFPYDWNEETNNIGRILVIYKETFKTMEVELYSYFDNDTELYEENKLNIKKPNQKSNKFKIYNYDTEDKYIRFSGYSRFAYLNNGLTEEQFIEYLKNKPVASSN